MRRCTFSFSLVAAVLLISLGTGARAQELFQPLGYLFPGDRESAANDVSADGSVVVGVNEGLTFRWTEAGGMEALHLDPAPDVPFFKDAQ